MTDEVSQEQKSGLLASRNFTIILAVVAVIGLVAACVFAYLLLRPSDDEESPTPFPTQEFSEEDTDVVLVTGVTESETVNVTIDTPVTLQFGEQSFVVRQEQVGTDGAWGQNVEGQGTAVWVYGTIINYVLGLPYSEDNQRLLEQLNSGDQITLITRDDVLRNFTVNNRNVVPAANQDIYAQNSPGITVVLLDMPGGERLIVQGNYLVPEADDSIDLGNVVELGEPAQLENLQITAMGASFVPDRLEALPGFAFFIIDYQVQNTGLTAIDTSRLQMVLLDQLGTQYVLSPQADTIGNLPPLSGFLNSGQTAEASVGFQIPIGLVSPTLNWVVSNKDSGSEVQVNIPYSADVNAAAQSAIIALESVERSQDGISLVLNGTVTNLGSQPFVVTEQDVKLDTTDGAVYLLLSTNPAFPWSVLPGQTAQYSVIFQRPLNTNTATFTVLNQSFQLTNLR